MLFGGRIGGYGRRIGGMSMRRFLLTCALVLFAALAANPAEADPVDDILAGFASSKYDEIEKTIGALAASGDASAPAILGALDAGRAAGRFRQEALHQRR